MAVFPFVPRPGVVERILPPGMEVAGGPAMITMLSYPQTPVLHAFKELAILVPARVGDVEGNYVPYIYVTTDEALIPGREICGFPKLLADIVWERDGARFHGSATRWGRRILSLEGAIADVMPPELAAAQAQASRRPTLNYKVVPGPAGEIEIEQITSVQLDIVPHQVEMGTGRVSCETSEFDPLSDLISESEGPLIVMLSDNTIPNGQVLERIDREKDSRFAA